METSERILRVALAIVDREGDSGLTTRAVCDAANIAAPTLYHHFGDKAGLQHAVARRVMEDFIEAKRGIRLSRDALIDLRRGWDGWIGFATAHPNQFRLMIEVARIDPGVSKVGYDLLRSIIERLAVEGRLRTDVETATQTVWAASNGVLSLFLQGEPAKRIRTISALMLESLVGRLVD